MQTNLELYTPGDVSTTLVDSPIIATSWATNYPKMAMIPGTGNFFTLAGNIWAIISKDTGVEIEKNFDFNALYGTVYARLKQFHL